MRRPLPLEGHPQVDHSVTDTWPVALGQRRSRAGARGLALDTRPPAQSATRPDDDVICCTPQTVERVDWYHTLELPGGVVTPGEYDLRRVPARIRFPASLAGMRCLDVGTRDGFWAFEMERRGAAEVVAIDLDDWRRLDWVGGAPPSLGDDTLSTVEARQRAFDVATGALGSSVRRIDLSVYDLSVEAVGEFDFVFLGTLLLHLRDPVGALMAVRKVVKSGGRLLVNDAVSLSLTALVRQPVAHLIGENGRLFWWVCNTAGLRRMVEAAGFEALDSGGPYFEPGGVARQIAPAPGRLALRQRINRQLHLRLGASHAWILATPG